MTHVIQYTILIVILIAAVAYAGRRIYLTWRHSNDKCYGCKGCALHDQILKKQASAHRKPACYEKKWDKCLEEQIIYLIFAHAKINQGTLADRLGNGLQNRVGQFDSARYLTNQRITIFSRSKRLWFFRLCPYMHPTFTVQMAHIMAWAVTGRWF